MKYLKLCGISVYITVEVSEDGESWERRYWTGLGLIDVLASCFPRHYQELQKSANGSLLTAELVFRTFGYGYIFDKEYIPHTE